VKTRKIVVPGDAGSVRIDQFLAVQEGINSRGVAQRLLREGLVRIGGEVVMKPATHISPGMVVSYEIPEAKPVHLTARSFPLEILYEDNTIIVVNKPPHRVVHPAPGHDEDTLVNALLAHTVHLAPMGGPRRPGIVHRLDKGTSGVLIVAKTDAAYLSLIQQFKDHRVKKIYNALVYGSMETETGTIDHAINRSARDRKKMSVVRVPGSGREAMTIWKVIKSFPGLSFLELSPHTGRTHQLRVHLASLGHPIVGDPVYGRRRFPTTGLLAPLAKEVKALGRQALHASKITFYHPETGKKLTIKAPCPEDLKNLYQKLEERFA